jgi:hypothetical protein
VDPSDPRQATDSAQQRGGQQAYKWNYVNGQLHGVQEAWYPSGVDPEDPWQATDFAQQRGGRQQNNKYYLDGVEVSQQVYQ